VLQAGALATSPFSSHPCSNAPARRHGERIPHTFISDPSYDLTSRRKHLLNWPILEKKLLKKKGSTEGKGFTVFGIPGFQSNIGRLTFAY
jgi:hypothetical protein